MIRREKIIFRGTENMPQYWKVYFSMSEIGKEYEILYTDEDPQGKGETLIMSNTEYEYYTNQRFFNEIKEGDEILSIGYGIGLIVPLIKKTGAKLTILEKYQEVIDLEKNLDSEINIIINDVNDTDFKTVFQNKKFDIIFSDTSEHNQRKNELPQLLKKNGKMLFWTHLSVNK